MDKQLYNANGVAVRQAVYFMEPASQTTTLVQPTDQSVRQIVNFTPTRNFGFAVTKDQDWNVDVHLRFNPKRFFVGATEIIKTYAMFRTALSGLALL